MPRYNYVALDTHGKETKGTIEVTSQNEAIGRVKEMGLFPTKIVETEKPQEKQSKKKTKAAGKKSSALNININIPGLSGRVKPKVLTTFTRQLATLVDAGLPLLRGLRVLEKQERNSTLKSILGELALAIEGGSTFSEALAQHPKVFNRLFVNMVKAGELGGVLEVVLRRLAEFSEKAQKIKGKIKAAMFYPVAVMIVAGGILIMLLTFVIPRFKAVFADMMEGAQLPRFTRIVMGISDAVKNHFLVVGACVAVFVVLFLLFIKTKFGRWLWDSFKLKVPVFGPVVRRVAISRFARTLGTLVSSGVPILQALIIVRETAGNVIISNAVSDVHESVKEGETITTPLESSGVFPPMVVSMVDVGEQTGALPEMLLKIADNYDEEVDNAVASMTALLEPIMIVFLAVIVGSIVIAMFLPLIAMISGLSGGGVNGGGGAGD
ncbi:MAG: type II secretion system F family protein [Limisphaerales bacterium]